MKGKMEDTVRVDAKNVDREVGEAFKNYVLKKHGKIRGVYSREVSAALAKYLSDHAPAEEEKGKNPNPTGAKRLPGVKELLKSGQTTKDLGKPVRLDAKSMDEKVVNTFMAFLLKKHGEKRGVKNTVLSGELTKALRWYLNEEEGRVFPTFLEGDSDE